MSAEVTRILSAIEQGDPSAAEQLLPLVYDELRKLAAQKLAHEKPGLRTGITYADGMSDVHSAGGRWQCSYIAREKRNFNCAL